MRKYKNKLCILLSICLLFSINGCQSSSTLKKIAKVLKVPADKGTIVNSLDTHGGFHGDGDTFLEIHFSDGHCLEAITESPAWNPLPLTDNLMALVYGLQTEDGSIGPILADEQLNPRIPEFQNGYYCFIDRHSESTDKKDDSAVLERTSYNFTIALYDVTTDTLYYMEMDT